MIPDKYAKTSNFLNIEHLEAEAAEIPFAAATVWLISPEHRGDGTGKGTLNSCIWWPLCSPRPRNGPPTTPPLWPLGLCPGLQGPAYRRGAWEGVAATSSEAACWRWPRQPAGVSWSLLGQPSLGCQGPGHSLAVCLAKARCHRGAPNVVSDSLPTGQNCRRRN